jgi:cell wall-associated NlpC family hydrolase
MAVGKAHALVGTNKYTMGGKGWNFDPQNDSDTAHKARWATITEIKQTKYTCDTCADNITIGVDCTGLVMWAFNQTFHCEDCPTCDKPECQGCPSYYDIPDNSNLCDPYTVIKQQGTEQQWYKDPHISRVNCFSSNKQEGAIDQFLKWSKGGWFNLEPGDIIYFLKPNTKRTHYGHCLIYMGAGWVIQSHSGAGVTVDRLKDILKNKYKGKTINDDLFGFIGVGRFSWNQQNNPQCPSMSTAQTSDQAKTAAVSYSLQYDDTEGAVVGAYVDGDRGHIVYFTPPSEAFTINKIKIFGAAKIKNTAELKNLVTVRIWDKDGENQLWSKDVPWSLFLSGTWQDIKVPNVSVNDDFQVEVVTHSQAQGDPIDIVSMTGIAPVMDVMGANMLRITGPVQGTVQSAVLIGFDYPKSCLESPSPSNCPETRSGYSYMGKFIDPGQGRLKGINWLIRVDGEGAAGN